MTVTVTGHAAQRCGQRDVPAREIRLAILRPDKVIHQRNGNIKFVRGALAVVTDATRRNVVTTYRLP